MSLLGGLDDVDTGERYWTLVDTEFTLVFPAGEEPAAHLVREIRAFDPNFVPLWLRKTYKDPQGFEVCVGYHVLGRWAAIADDESRLPLRLERPALKTVLFPFVGGVVYDQRTICDEWREGSEQRRLKCPDIFVPFDNRLVRWAAAAHRRLMREAGAIKQKVLDGIDARTAAEAKGVESVQAEARHSLKGDKNMIRRAIDQGKLTDAPKDAQPYVQATKVFEGAPS